MDSLRGGPMIGAWRQSPYTSILLAGVRLAQRSARAFIVLQTPGDVDASIRISGIVGTDVGFTSDGLRSSHWASIRDAANNGIYKSR